MINRTALNEELAILTGVSRQTLDRIGGSLRKAGMVSVGGRGPNAPYITPEDAKNILLGLLGTDNASKAADAVKVLSELKSSVGEKLGDAIVRLFTDENYRKDLAGIHVTRNFPLVELYWGYEGYPDGLEGVFEPQREEIYGTADGCQGMQIKAILNGNIFLNSILGTAAELVCGDNSSAAEAQKRAHEAQKRAKENREKGLAYSFTEADVKKSGLTEAEYEVKVLADMKAKREKSNL